MEIAIKSVFTMAVALMIWGLLKATVIIWRSQIDPEATVSQIIAKLQKAPTELIATRDIDAFYQDGQVVGRTVGEIREMKGGVLLFEEVADTSKLKQDQPIEFRRMKIRIESFESFAHIKAGVTTRTAVFSKLQCRIIPVQ